jgi:23S rRNA (guanosine2251-2'-O)-methyltransferase
MHLEGRVSVRAAIDAGRRTIEKILLGDDADPERVADVLATAKAKGIPVRQVRRGEIDEIAPGKSHGGVLAICSERAPDPESALVGILEREKTPFVLLLDGVDDARNLAFTLRTAEALGVHAALIRRQKWDFDETDLSRTSSGAWERMCIVRADREAEILKRLKARGLALWACVPNVMRTIAQADLRGPVVVGVGGEKRGLSGTVRSICTGFMRIPMKPGSTSLSMSHAAAIVMYEVLRQRTS